MSQFFINPVLFTAGLIAISAPIIIHLLNRRRFKRVDWAAMDFLLEAQRLNKRRVKLEELILLILRCLAIILIGLFLARPSLNVDMRGVLKAEQTERVIVLDDSLSMGSGGKEEVPIERLSNVLEKGINAILNNNDQDLITIVRTTDPNRFNPNAVALNEDSISNLLNGFKEIKASDQRGDLISALNHVNDSFDSKEVNFNKVVYLMTDLRLTDWESINSTDMGQGVPDLIKKISEKSAGFYIVDLGSGNERNLSIESVAPLDKALVNEVPSDFEVNVRNYSNSTVSDIEVNFSAKGSLPLKKTISNIDPGALASVQFTYTFNEDLNDVSFVPIEISLSDTLSEGVDSLSADNKYFFPASVTKGIRTLIVDGDPSGVSGRGESFYLANALAPRGPAPSGVQIMVMEEADFQSSDISQYDVIFIANLYRINEDIVSKLKGWVSSGGGLVFLLGDQIDEDVYNDLLFKDGEGLLPLKLLNVGGDDKEEAWVYFKKEKENHPLFRFFEGDNNQLLDEVKVFRWWNTEFDSDFDENNPSNIIASFNPTEDSVAIAEKQIGDGRVLAMTTPLDNDWSNFPENGASFLITAQELVRYMSPNIVSDGIISVSEPINHIVDVRKFRQQAKIITPDLSDASQVDALPVGGNKGEFDWMINFEQTKNQGIYEIQKEKADGSGNFSVLFAANTDQLESNLKRIAPNEIRSKLESDKIKLLNYTEPILEADVNINKSEVWKLVLIVLTVILLIELFYGWRIGARR